MWSQGKANIRRRVHALLCSLGATDEAWDARFGCNATWQHAATQEAKAALTSAPESDVPLLAQTKYVAQYAPSTNESESIKPRAYVFAWRVLEPSRNTGVA